MNAQQSELFDLLDGFEMTKSQHDWLERRFENMTVKESLLFRGAMQIERPQMTADVMLIANQLDHYDLFYGAGDDARLGKFVMEQIQRPSSQAREFLDPEKVGAAYRQKSGNIFCDGHFVHVTMTRGSYGTKTWSPVFWRIIATPEKVVIPLLPTRRH